MIAAIASRSDEVAGRAEQREHGDRQQDRVEPVTTGVPPIFVYYMASGIANAVSRAGDQVLGTRAWSMGIRQYRRGALTSWRSSGRGHGDPLSVAVGRRAGALGGPPGGSAPTSSRGRRANISALPTALLCHRARVWPGNQPRDLATIAGIWLGPFRRFGRTRMTQGRRVAMASVRGPANLDADDHHRVLFDRSPMAPAVRRPSSGPHRIAGGICARRRPRPRGRSVHGLLDRELARHLPSAGGMYAYVANGLGSFAGWLMAWAFSSPSRSCRPPLRVLRAVRRGPHHRALQLLNDWLWLPLAILCGLLVWWLVYRGIGISTRVGVVPRPARDRDLRRRVAPAHRQCRLEQHPVRVPARR